MNKNKIMLLAFWTLIISNTIFVLEIAIIIDKYIGESYISDILLFLTVIIFITSMLIALKLEISIGYYTCDRCNKKFIPEYYQAFKSPHIIFKRYMRCPLCGEKTWMKKTFDDLDK